jgi:hypothetical protein
MTTYYRDDHVRITSAEVSMDGVRFPLAKLEYVWHRKGTPNARVISRRAARWGLVVAALVLAVAWAVKTPALLMFGPRVPNVFVRVALVVAVSLAFVALVWPLAELVLTGLDHVYLHGVSVHEIWARYCGREVLLLRTSDKLLFGRVYRALIRALENESS